MLIEEMLTKRDIATSLCVALQNQIGNDIAGVFEMDDFEVRTFEDFDNYVDSEMKRLNLKVMIFTGWAFTKEIFHKQYEYLENTDKYFLYFPELITMIITDSKETLLNDVIKKIKDEVKAVSQLNIKSIDESDNGIQINYFTKSALKFFEERPKTIEEIIDERK